MIFTSMDQLLHMGGHGPYVWASYLVTMAAMVALVVLPLVGRRRVLRDIARRTQREVLLKAAAAAATPSANLSGEN